MSFIHYIPSDILKPFVISFAISINEDAGSYKVLPGTSIVMGFQYSGNLSYSEEGKFVSLKNAGITGLMDKYRLFSNSEKTSTVLVMFSETGASAFFKIPLHELFGQSVSLDDLILHSQMDVISEKLNDAKTDIEHINIVEEFLISRLNYKAHDEMVNLAVSFIKQSGGNIKIALLAEKLNISQSRLEKRFRAIVGASPKKFASIIRMKQIVNEVPESQGRIGLGLDAGFYDQSHFIKDFKSFTGQTPEQFFAKK